MKTPAVLTAYLSRLDAMTLRERALVFIAITAVFVALLNAFSWSPQQAKQKKLKLEQGRVAGEIIITQNAMQQKITLQANDPDAANRVRQQQLQQDKIVKSFSLVSERANLVPPDKIAGLLEGVLKQNERLRLVSLRSIDPTGVGGTAAVPPPALASSGQNVSPASPARGVAAPTAAPTATLATALATAPATAPANTATAAIPGAVRPAVAASAGNADQELIFRHGVRIVIEGSYLDLLDYMTTLEQLPGKIYWGNLEFEVKTHPKAYLTLDLYTLSLDGKWLNL
jgi:MSHA biogenesis protein MshJ